MVYCLLKNTGLIVSQNAENSIKNLIILKIGNLGLTAKNTWGKIVKFVIYANDVNTGEKQKKKKKKKKTGGIENV